MKNKALLISAVLFSAIIIYLLICLNSANNTTSEANKFSNELVSQIKLDYANQIKAEQDKVVHYNKSIDSLKTLLNYSEIQRTKNFKYYETKTNEIKNFNNDSRLRYLDSLFISNNIK